MNYEGLDTCVRGLRNEMVDFTSELVGIASENPPGNAYPECVRAIASRLRALELPCEVLKLQAQGVSVVCVADLPPSPPSKTRYLVKRLHAALPEVRILVGRWGPRALSDDSTQLLRDAGATLVASSLEETRTYLGGLVEMPRIPPAGADSVQAA